MKWKYTNLFFSFLFGVVLTLTISVKAQEIIYAEGDRTSIHPVQDISLLRSLNVGDYDAIMYKLNLIHRACEN